MLFTSYKLPLKSAWVLILWFVIGIGPNLTWFKPFDLNLCILPKPPSGWLVLVLKTMNHTPVRLNLTVVGRPARDSPHFGSISYMLLLNSNTHQNLWNLLVLVRI